METRDILHQLLDQDNWQVIDEIDHFLFVYDKMPPRMKIIIDLKMTGYRNKDIAVLLHIAVGTVNCQIFRAKRRLMESML